MKKVKKDAPRQARRTAALARFKTNSARKDDAPYMARKAMESAALHRALGTSA
jgi:hypothetical protein